MKFTEELMMIGRHVKISITSGSTSFEMSTQLVDAPRTLQTKKTNTNVRRRMVRLEWPEFCIVARARLFLAALRTCLTKKEQLSTINDGFRK